ncbi:MAG: pyruvate kinase [Thiobacillaceae bacterium]|jgi:pyruvate kinase|nr:pyruvate kinase [Thiobacillaceae bacterium]
MAKRHLTRHLIPALESLRDHLLAVERGHRKAIRAAHPQHRDSARNLLHYLALRQSDLRDLQRELGLLGLSRLGRAEAHTLSSLDAVLAALHALAGDPPRARRKRKDSVDLSTGDMRLEEHARALLGQPAGKRATRVMVTMPGEAAVRPELIRDLLLAGMDVMRINCAHDDAEAWLAMIRHLRAAEAETGRGCKVYADLAGPKLRTGALKPAGRLAEFGPRRDVWGTVIEPASVWLTPRGSTAPPPEAAGTVLPVDDALLARARKGDVLEVEDCRGMRRELRVVGRQGDAWLAHAHQHVYLREDAACFLRRDDAQLAAGRVGPLPEVVLPLLLRPGDRLLLTGEEQPGEAARLDHRGKLLRPAAIPCTLDAVFAAAAPGQRVWFDDGRIGGRILANTERVISVEIDHAAPQGSKLRPEKGINLPDTRLAIPALTDKDRADLGALAAHVDVVGLSFVREPDDVLALEEALAGLDAEHLGIVLKIETRQAFENLPLILLASLRSPPVGLMVARGDLAVEIGFERLAEVQEEILWLAEAAHVPVIWATQVLESMAKRGAPSRAEVSDAALGVRAECVMLNKGPYIVETVRFLADILERMSAHRKKSRPTMRRLAVSQLGGKGGRK